MDNKIQKLMKRAVSTLTKMKSSTLDDQTAMDLRRLLYIEDTDILYQEEEPEPEPEPDLEVRVGAEAGLVPEAEVESVENKLNPVYETNDNEQENLIVGFGRHPDFMRKIQSGEINVRLLTQPPVGMSIDGITLPIHPPIKSLEGLIGNCSIPFEKQLTITDLKNAEGRLNFPKKAMQNFLMPMLTEEENDLIEDKIGIKVMVYDEKGTGFPMSFKIWSEKMHVLALGWNKYIQENNLKPLEDWVTVWLFRNNTTDEPCFAVIRRRFPIGHLLPKPRKSGCNGESKNKAQKKKKQRTY